MDFKNCTFVFLRHGETTANDNDFARELTPGGINQVLALRKKHEDFGIFFDVFISSSSIRAMQTARIMNDTKNKEIIELDILYSLPDPEESKILIDMLKRDGNLSLQDYHRIEKGENFDLLMKIGVEGTNKLEGDVLRFVHDQKILVVGHSGTLQSLVYTMFPTSELVRNISRESILYECQAIKIVTDKEGKVAITKIVS